jgi:bacterioferritin (cytochrome b1)
MDCRIAQRITHLQGEPNFNPEGLATRSARIVQEKLGNGRHQISKVISGKR